MVAGGGATPGTPGSAVGRLVLLGVIWGATFPIARLGVATGADPFLLVTVAFAIAAVVTAPLAAATRTPFPSGRRLLESSGAGALLIGGINLPLFWGERYATGGAASVVYACAPLVSVACVALAGSGERIGRRAALALGLGLAGVLVLALASGGAAVTSVWGLVAFGVGATCQGSGAVVLGRLRPSGERLWGETFQFVGGGAASLVVLAVVAPHATIALNPSVVASVLYVGVASMAAGYAIFFDLIHRHGAVAANEVTYLNPVVALALGVFAFGEPFAPEEVAGLALILVALVLLNAPRPRAEAKPRAPEPVPPGPSGSHGAAP
jgi:probable blue pigment (indigoidine) exporter